MTSRIGTSEQQPGVDAAAAGEELAGLGPVHHPAAGDPAGAEHQVGALERVEQPGQLLGLVGAVGVHLDQDVVAVVDAPAEAGQVGGAEALLARAGAARAPWSSAAASSSASLPVPSGLLSSATRTSASGTDGPDPLRRSA